MSGGGSLKFRLFTAAAFAVSLALLAAGLGFYLVFQTYVERQAADELENHYVQLIAGIRVDETGKLRARSALSDPRFQKPYGGLYWQINEQGQEPLRSRSLFDHLLAVPALTSSATVHVIDGPDATRLFASEKMVNLPIAGSSERHLSVTIAIDRRDIDNAVNWFGWYLGVGLGLLYAALLAAAYLQIAVGLRPMKVLRRSVEGVMQGSATRIEGQYPSEVTPLVQEVNALLAARAQQLERARQRASNLAHGLKTPLTVMSALADKIAGSGFESEARDIHDGTLHMRLLVDRELTRARMSSGHAVKHILLAPVVGQMIDALKKTALKENLVWHASVPSDASIAMETGDLTELVGNLLDNARKWAKGQIYVSWHDGVLIVEDDGSGVPDDQLAAIQERGVRLDEKISGTGLGLGIVRDLAEVYGFTLKLERSSLGGLSVSISTQLLRIERPA